MHNLLYTARQLLLCFLQAPWNSTSRTSRTVRTDHEFLLSLTWNYSPSRTSRTLFLDHEFTPCSMFLLQMPDLLIPCWYHILSPCSVFLLQMPDLLMPCWYHTVSPSSASCRLLSPLPREPSRPPQSLSRPTVHDPWSGRVSDTWWRKCPAVQPPRPARALDTSVCEPLCLPEETSALERLIREGSPERIF